MCALEGLAPGEAECVDDPVSGRSRWVFGCQSNFGWLFEEDPSLFDPTGVTERGYVTGVDCNDPMYEGRLLVSEEEAARAECGTHALTGEVRCLYDREQAVGAEAAASGSWDRYDPALNDFPRTQNLVSCAQPGEGNAIPYVELDTLSGVYTDAHVAAAQPAIDAMHAAGQKYYGYLNVPSPETKTTWPGSSVLGNSAPWATMAYQYAYWAEKLGEDIGDPTGSYAPFPTACYDVDGDGFDNRRDNCPFVYNPGVGGRQPDSDWDGIGDACDPSPDTDDGPDVDGDGVPQVGGEDNCPMIANPVDGTGVQPDTDNNGIGDACYEGATLVWTCDGACPAACGPTERSDGTCTSVPLEPCDAAAGVACVDTSGEPMAGQTMRWTFDLFDPRTRDLLVAWTRLGVLAGMDGMTYDVALPPDCWGESVVPLFQQFLTHGGRFDRDIRGSSDPDDLARQRLYDEVVAEASIGDPGSFDVSAYRRGMSDPAWRGSAMSRAFTLFKADFMRAFMKRVREDVEAFMAEHRPGEDFGTFFNQGSTTLFNSMVDAGGPGGYSDLKDVAGAETFVRSGHAGYGAYDCVGTEGSVYPTNGTLEWLYDLHAQDGLRFWSWNFPGEVPDDRPILFAAEALSHGGIAQAPFCSVEELYPYAGYTRPDHTMRLAQAPVAPFVSAVWPWLNLPKARAQVALYLPQVLDEGCYGSPDFGFAATKRLYAMLRELGYTVDVIGGSPFGMGRARLPSTAELHAYDFVAVGTEFLSTGELDRLEQYLQEGGRLVATGNVGRYDEWCRWTSPGDPTRDGWLGHFDHHGANAVGTGTLYWLDGTTAYVDPGGTPHDAQDALTYLDAPNAGERICPSGAASCGGTGETFDPAGLPVTDVAGEREMLRDWLEGELSSFGLPAGDLAAALPPEVHATVREGPGGTPVYHLVSYALETVEVDPWLDGDRAGAYESRVGHFACTTPRSVGPLPVPEGLRASGGVAHAVALDYGPPSEGFFPNTCEPSAPCAQPPLYGGYPDASGGWSFPEATASFGAGETTVDLRWPDGSPLTMKQWLVVWFEAP